MRPRGFFMGNQESGTAGKKNFIMGGVIMKITRFFGLSVFFLFFIILTLNSSTQATPLGTKSTAPPNLALKDLPAGAQASISGALGKDNPAYHFTPVVDGWRIRHLSQGLEGTLNSKGLRLRAGEADLSLKLLAYGRGKALKPLAPTVPQADANRLEYQRGPVTEWYLNGPIGLEQGFTVYAPPESSPMTQAKSETNLTLALLLETNLKVRIDAGEKGLTLSHPNNQAVLSYGGLTAFDAAGRELPAALEYNALKKQLLVHVNDTGASYPLTIDPWIQSAKLTASDGKDQLEGPYFGYAVAVSGDTIVVGAYKADLGGQPGSGKAYVFVKPTNGWKSMTQTAKLAFSSGSESWDFGFAVAISGDAIVVGAKGTTVNFMPDRGAAYVFIKPGAGWSDMTQTAKLTAFDYINSFALGNSVAISGDTIVVGVQELDVSHALKGAAYVFVKPVSGWLDMTQTAKLRPSDAAYSSGFGTSVGISGDTIVAGANSIKGAAYVFVRPTGGWKDMTQSAKLTASDGGVEYGLGFSAAISGDTIAAGSSVQNSVYVFVKPSGGWKDMTQSAKLTASDGAAGDGLGISAAISGDTIVAGAFKVQINKTPPGAAYIFIKPSGGWAGVQTQSAKLDVGEICCAFGWAVAISGGTVVIGTYDQHFTPEAAYVFIQGSLSQHSVYLPLTIR